MRAQSHTFSGEYAGHVEALAQDMRRVISAARITGAEHRAPAPSVPRERANAAPAEPAGAAVNTSSSGSSSAAHADDSWPHVSTSTSGDDADESTPALPQARRHEATHRPEVAAPSFSALLENYLSRAAGSAGAAAAAPAGAVAAPS